MTRIHPTLATRFGANLAAERERRKLTPEKMATLIGVTRVYVHYLERGERTPSLEMVEMIAGKLKLKPIDMLR